jgi:regulator of cell morphogenesis and NO signaling
MIDPSIPVATIVLDHSECAAVFDRHRIDYCCRGRRSLAEVATAQGLRLAELIDELETAIARRIGDPTDPRELSTRDLITVVIARHHRYLHRTLPFLRALAEKVARAHGAKVESLGTVAMRVNDLADTLLDHLEQEERFLFPALLAGEDATAELLAMCTEHDAVGAILQNLRAAAADYVTPEWA